MLNKYDRLPFILTIAYAAVWLVMWVDWLAWRRLNDYWYWIGFTPSLYAVVYWMTRWRFKTVIRYRAAASLCIFPVWQWLVYFCYANAWLGLSATLARGR